MRACLSCGKKVRIGSMCKVCRGWICLTCSVKDGHRCRKHRRKGKA